MSYHELEIHFYRDLHQQESKMTEQGSYRGPKISWEKVEKERKQVVKTPKYYMFISPIGSRKLVSSEDVPERIHKLIHPRAAGLYMWDSPVKEYIQSLPDWEGDSPDPNWTHYNTYLDSS